MLDSKDQEQISEGDHKVIPRPNVSIVDDNEAVGIEIKGQEEKKSALGSVMASLPSVKKSWSKKVAVGAEPPSLPTAEDYANLEDFKDRV